MRKMSIGLKASHCKLLIEAIVVFLTVGYTLQMGFTQAHCLSAHEKGRQLNLAEIS